MPHVYYIGGNNVSMRGTENEDRQFVSVPDENVPLVVEAAGITPPNPKYFISRKICDHYVILHIVSGKGTLIYNGKEYALKAQDTMLLQPKSSNTYFPDPEDPFKLLWVNFFSDALGELIAELGLRDIPVVSGVACADKLNEIVNLTKTTPNNNHLCFPTLRIITDLLVSLAEKVQMENRFRVETQLALAIRDMLEEAVYGKVDINGIAAKLYISVSSVYREFEKCFGESPYQYVLNRKIALAKSYLFRTNYPISVIAEKLAFSDAFYFSNLFKKKTGYSPSAYRKQAHNPPPQEE